MTYHPSITDRIAWSSGELRSAEVKVLVALWSCGDYGTGRNCHPYRSTLVTRSGVSLATVKRCLRDLRDPHRPGGPWIVARRRHRHPTVYDLCLDRFATQPPKEQQMTIEDSVTYKSEAQFDPLTLFEAQNEPQGTKSEAQNEPPTSDPDLVPDVRTHTPRAREDASTLPGLVGAVPPAKCAHPNKHAWCHGRVHVPRDLHFEFLDRLGTRPGESPTAKAGRLVAFYADTMDHLSPAADVVNAYVFWNAAFEAWLGHGARRRGEPKASRGIRSLPAIDYNAPEAVARRQRQAEADRWMETRRAEAAVIIDAMTAADRAALEAEAHGELAPFKVGMAPEVYATSLRGAMIRIVTEQQIRERKSG